MEWAYLQEIQIKDIRCLGSGSYGTIVNCGVDSNEGVDAFNVRCITDSADEAPSLSV